MAISLSHPGVYVQEIPSGVRTIVGVPTSIALFVGFSKQGPVNSPVLCSSYADYARAFGEDVTASEMTQQVRLFFLNGGAKCYVMRVAEGTQSAAITLEDELGAATLTLSARSPGTAGELIRASVTYGGSQPEDTFNLELFRWEALPNGTLVARDAEVFRGLSMDSGSGSYAESVLNASSKLVTATTVAPATTTARSIAMRSFGVGTADDDIDALLGTSKDVLMSINGSAYVRVTLPLSPSNEATYVTDVQSAITAGFATAGLPAPAGVTASFVGTTSRRLQVASSNGNVFVRRAPTRDAAVALRFGTEQGGVEVTRSAHRRPAATGVTLATPDIALLEALAGAAAGNITITLNKYDASKALAAVNVLAPIVVGNPLGTLGSVRDAINAGPTLADGESWPWKAELWGHRLAVLPKNGPLPAGADDNRPSGFVWAGAGTPTARLNTRYYSLGTSGTSTFASGGQPGLDGTPPAAASTYDAAYAVARREVDLFNLMVLPRCSQAGAIALEQLWANASVYCESRRALLLMEGEPSWTGAQVPTTKVDSLRIGLSKQYAALYYPRIELQEGRTRVKVGATGAVAGLMARIDNSRGVWKAPAGTEADLRGIAGVGQQLADPDSGELNPRGINAIRQFPTGIVVWGARTMDGDDSAASEYKYVPIRRLAMYIEESLYRALRWVVFEPNDEPLWAQIRLNVGAFMNGLYRQGAFQGRTPSEAYFVKCDSETTTQNDRDLGIVNIQVGFAPLKPAEFVVITLQQMAGQIEV